MTKALTLALLLLGTNLGAQESYTLDVTAERAARIANQITIENGNTCARRQLHEACTQQEACIAAKVTTEKNEKSECTADEATAAGVRIFDSSTKEGRQEFILALLATRFRDFDSASVYVYQKKQCVWWTDAVRTKEERQEICLKLNQPADCQLCQ